MCPERSRRSSAVNRLQYGSFNFQESQFIEIASHRSDHPGSLQKYLSELGIHRQINIPHPVALFRIGKRIKRIAVSIFFHYRQRTQCL